MNFRGISFVDLSKHRESKFKSVSLLYDDVKRCVLKTFIFDCYRILFTLYSTRMVTTIYYNGKKLKTLLEDTALNSNKIHEGGVFVLGQESVSYKFSLLDGSCREIYWLTVCN